MKHTKGNWSIDEANADIFWYQIKSDIPNRGWIAEAKGEHVNKGMGEEEQLANAKLIVAAPAMLKALDDIRQTLIFANNENDKGLIELAETAINKATA